MGSLKAILERVGVKVLNSNNNYWNFAELLILKLQGDGATFLFQADGERSHNIYTLMIQGGPLGEDYLRCETDDLCEGISQIFSDYFQRFWN